MKTALAIFFTALFVFGILVVLPAAVTAWNAVSTVNGVLP